MLRKYSKMIMVLFLSLVFGGLFLGVHPIATVFAQQPTPSDDDVNAIASQLFCPVCENTPLDVCPTEACRQWRDLIRQMLADGKSVSEIQQYFVDNYGARVLSEPPRQGINWLVYIVPPLAFLGGAYLLFRAFLAWKQLAKQSKSEENDNASPMPPSSDVYASQFEDELKKRK